MGHIPILNLTTVRKHLTYFLYQRIPISKPTLFPPNGQPQDMNAKNMPPGLISYKNAPVQFQTWPRAEHTTRRHTAKASDAVLVRVRCFWGATTHPNRRTWGPEQSFRLVQALYQALWNAWGIDIDKK